MSTDRTIGWPSEGKLSERKESDSIIILCSGERPSLLFLSNGSLAEVFDTNIGPKKKTQRKSFDFKIEF